MTLVEVEAALTFARELGHGDNAPVYIDTHGILRVGSAEQQRELVE